MDTARGRKASWPIATLDDSMEHPSAGTNEIWHTSQLMNDHSSCLFSESSRVAMGQHHLARSDTKMHVCVEDFSPLSGLRISFSVSHETAF